MPERELWQAVLATAIADANRPGRDLIGRTARDWIEGFSKDFRMVCDLAGMDPTFIHDAWKSGRLARFSKTNREKTCA